MHSYCHLKKRILYFFVTCVAKMPSAVFFFGNFYNRIELGQNENKLWSKRKEYEPYQTLPMRTDSFLLYISLCRGILKKYSWFRFYKVIEDSSLRRTEDMSVNWTKNVVLLINWNVPTLLLFLKIKIPPNVFSCECLTSSTWLAWSCLFVSRLQNGCHRSVNYRCVNTWTYNN